MTADDRARITAQIVKLQAASESTAAPEHQKSRLGLVATMLMAYPMAGGSEESGRARASAYLSALDDIPPWAVNEAIRRWHRGEGGNGANYRFAPAPAELRYAAMQLLQPAKQTIAHLNDVLSAIPIERAMDPRPIEKPAVATQPRLRLM